MGKEVRGEGGGNSISTAATVVMAVAVTAVTINERIRHKGAAKKQACSTQKNMSKWSTWRLLHLHSRRQNHQLTFMLQAEGLEACHAITHLRIAARDDGLGEC